MMNKQRRKKRGNNYLSDLEPYITKGVSKSTNKAYRSAVGAATVGRSSKSRQATRRKRK